MIFTNETTQPDIPVETKTLDAIVQHLAAAGVKQVKIKFINSGTFGVTSDEMLRVSTIEIHAPTSINNRKTLDIIETSKTESAI